jgi:hypothetical protein
MAFKMVDHVLQLMGTYEFDRRSNWNFNGDAPWLEDSTFPPMRIDADS